MTVFIKISASRGRCRPQKTRLTDQPLLSVDLILYLGLCRIQLLVRIR